MQSAIITGASRGIGRAIALRLANAYTHFYLLGRDKSALDEVCSEVSARRATSTPLVCDLAQTDQISKAVSAIEAKQVDLLINNAGMAVVKPFEELSIEDWNKTLAVNVTAPFLLLQQLLPRMQKGSSIVNILSVAARTGFGQWSSYCMSKFALDGFSQSVREELRDRGIRVINIYPAATNTDIWNDVPGEWSRDKMMTAEEIAAAVEYAVSRPPSVLVEEIKVGNTGGTL